jgi:hypothetical protein
MLLILSLNGLAFAELSESDINFFLEKIATANNEQLREQGINMIKMYADREDPNIDGLKKAVKKFVEPIYGKKFEEKGYDFDECIESLDVLKEISREDIKSLISHMEDKDLDGMKEIVNKYIEEDSNEDEEKSSSGSGETLSTPEENKTTNTEEVTVPKVETPKVEFKDLDKHWAKEDIEFLASKGIINGKSKEMFNPDGKITRAEFTALIVRLFDLKQKNTSFNISFKDVNNTDWYYDVIKTASEYGLINGINEDTFAPNKEVTREEMVTIIIRAIDNKNIQNTNKSNIAIDNFNDKNNMSTWAVDNINKALKMNIIKGKTENSFNPKEYSTRAESATIIKRVYDLINKK